MSGSKQLIWFGVLRLSKPTPCFRCLKQIRKNAYWIERCSQMEPVRVGTHDHYFHRDCVPVMGQDAEVFLRFIRLRPEGKGGEFAHGYFNSARAQPKETA